MGRDLAESSPTAHHVFKTADQLLGTNLSALCWHGPVDELNDTYNTQPALYTCSLSALAALRADVGDFTPALAAGHSLGEITALAAVGSISFQAGLKLVRERGRLMKLAGEREPGGMAAIIQLEQAKLIDICAQASAESDLEVQVANDNCPGQLVISGHSQLIDTVIQQARSAGARRAQRLPISIAAHSPLMKSIASEFYEAVQLRTFGKPDAPIIANTTAEPILTEYAIRRELNDQLTAQVRWRESMLYLLSEGITDFVELGPKNVLTGLLRRIEPTANSHALGTPSAIAGLIAE